jgi:crossover junction endodeoxyribonuclease RuvC
MQARRILGFDPGYGRLGFGVIDFAKHEAAYVSCGVLTTPAGGRMGERLYEIARDVRTLFDKYQPQEMVIEALFFAKNTTTALQVAEVRGVLLLLAEEAGIPVKEVKPVEVKLALTGYGKADKKQMQEMIKTVLRLPSVPQPDDAADALAIAWTGAGKLIV